MILKVVRLFERFGCIWIFFKKRVIFCSYSNISGEFIYCLVDFIRPLEILSYISEKTGAEIFSLVWDFLSFFSSLFYFLGVKIHPHNFQVFSFSFFFSRIFRERDEQRHPFSLFISHILYIFFLFWVCFSFIYICLYLHEMIIKSKSNHRQLFLWFQ